MCADIRRAFKTSPFSSTLSSLENEVNSRRCRDLFSLGLVFFSKSESELTNSMDQTQRSVARPFLHNGFGREKSRKDDFVLSCRKRSTGMSQALDANLRSTRLTYFDISVRECQNFTVIPSVRTTDRLSLSSHILALRIHPFQIERCL